MYRILLLCLKRVFPSMLGWDGLFGAELGGTCLPVKRFTGTGLLDISGGLRRRPSCGATDPR